MDTYEQILVAFLASALAILLVLSIIFLIKLIKVINKVNRISEKAEVAVNKFSDIGAILQRFAGPLMVGKFVAKKFKGGKRARRNDNA
jgi:hypothetical protein